MFSNLSLTICLMIPLPWEIDWAYGELHAPFNSPLVGMDTVSQRIRGYQALHFVGVKEEILDYYWENQSHWTGLTHPSKEWINQFADFLRVTHSEIKDYPKIKEANWLPNYEHATEMLSINLKVDEYLKDISWYYLDKSSIIRNIKYQNDWYYEVWKNVKYSRMQWNMIDRRKSLQFIKDALKIKNLAEFYIQEAYPYKLFAQQPDLSGK